jgi:imidazoleglycerol phosphate synthase glutamine amidotransferase subunit HisH
VDGLIEALERRVRGEGAPFLGICVGMQLLADRGVEFETAAGLGWIAGETNRLQPGDPILFAPGDPARQPHGGTGVEHLRKCPAHLGWGDRGNAREQLFASWKPLQTNFAIHKSALCLTLPLQIGTY